MLKLGLTPPGRSACDTKCQNTLEVLEHLGVPLTMANSR